MNLYGRIAEILNISKLVCPRSYEEFGPASQTKSSRAHMLAGAFPVIKSINQDNSASSPDHPSF
jgi:hypothetical protein